MKLFSLENQNILVTGATGYLGQAMCLGLAEAGANILVNSRSREKAASLVARINSLGFKAETAVFDVTSEESVCSYSKSINNMPINCIVSNAYAGGSGTISCTEDSDYINSYNVSVVATNRIVRLLMPNLKRSVRESGGASVVNIASMYGIVSPDVRIYDSIESSNPPFYGAAKAALIQWTKYAACEFAKEGIRFNSISPGPFPSNDAQILVPELMDKLVSKVPMGRIGSADELQGAVIYLASNASSYVTGSNLVVDGGWTSW